MHKIRFIPLLVTMMLAAAFVLSCDNRGPGCRIAMFPSRSRIGLQNRAKRRARWSSRPGASGARGRV